MPNSSNKPTLIPHPENIVPKLSTRSVLNVGGIWGTLGAGQTVLDADGSRFIWSADSMSVVFSQNGKFYLQSGKAFADEVRTAPFVRAGRASAFMARVAETEMKLLLGILAGSGNVGFALVIGSEVLEFVVDNRENFDLWRKQLSAILHARAILKSVAPVLYEKVFTAALRLAIKDTEAKIPDAVTPEIVAFAVGVIVGHVGHDIAKGHFSILGIVIVVCQQTLTRLLLSVLPGAIKLTAEQYGKLAEETISKLREAGIVLADGDVKKIMEEIRQHPKEVKAAFDLMRPAFESMMQQEAHPSTSSSRGK